MTDRRPVRPSQRGGVPVLAVLGVFVLLCGVYEYGRVLHLPPQPHHLWRQTNCLAIAYNYYAWEWNLFRPAVMSMISDHGLSGRSAGEFPVIYYVIGLLWKVTGPQEVVFRSLKLLLHAGGTLALFRAASLVIGDRSWAAFALDTHHWIPDGQDLASTTISHSFGLVMITKAQLLRPSSSRSSVNGPVLVQQGCSVVTTFTESWLNRVD